MFYNSSQLLVAQVMGFLKGPMSNKRVIISGISGFIGYHLAVNLINQGYTVLGIVRPNSVHLERLSQLKLDLVVLDIQQIDQLPKMITGTYDTFFHLAWAGCRAPERDDAKIQQSNHYASLKALQAAKDCGCSCFIATGSQAEYGIMHTQVSEKYQSYQPYNEYGKAKLMTYFDTEKLSKTLGIRFIWARIFSTYGIYDSSSAMITQCINLMRTNECVPLTSATQLWNYIHVEDVAEILRLLAEKESTQGLYHIASLDTRPLKEFILEIKALMKSDSILDFSAIPYGLEGPINLQPLITRIQSELKWKTRIDFKTGITKILNHSKEPTL